MVNLTRRSFLGGLLAVTAVAIVKAPKFNTYPVLYMDGERDDSPALQAMLDGKPYILEGELIKGTTHISGGEYFIHSGLNVSNEHTIIEHAKFTTSPNFRGYMVNLDAGYVAIKHCIFIGNNHSGGINFSANSTFETKDPVYLSKGDNIRAGTPLNTDWNYKI